jgi:hypothetical protein
MSFVTIRIDRQNPGASDFRVTLIEENGSETRAVLLKSEFTSGPWVVSLSGMSPSNATDIVQRVSNASSEDRDHSDFQLIAQTLYRWLLPVGPVRERWLALNNANSPPLYIEIQVDALGRLPWELACSPPPLRRPAQINGLYRLNAPQPVALQCSSWPLRILIVVGCSAWDEAALGVKDEVVAIERSFLPLGRSVDVHCLYRPDKIELMTFIRTFHPHVFHFAGHGGKLPGPQNKFGLRFDLQNNPWVWSAGDIDGDLPAWRWAPRFVFLNACRSAAEQNGSWSVQRSFLDGGAKASLGMQANTRGDLAGTFASKLYELCARGETLDDATHEARIAVGAKVPSYDHIDWALPALATTDRNLKLFDPRPRPTSLSFHKCREFEDVRFFANCRQPRREFTHWVYPAIPTKSAKNALVVLGEPKSGKSHLLKWCMENWAIGGARVRYIELHDGTPKTFISILRQIREGEADEKDETQYLHAGLSKTAFKRFNWELNNLTRIGEAGEWVEAQHPEPEIPDDGNPLTAKGDKRPEPILGAGFLMALKAAAGRDPLILVFDKLGGPKGERLIPTEDFEQLIRCLFCPIADDHDSLVKFAISATAEEASDYQLALIPQQNRVEYKVRVDFEGNELVNLAAEMLWFHEQKEVEELATTLLVRLKPGDRMKGLARLRIVLQALQGYSILDNVARMQ